GQSGVLRVERGARFAGTGAAAVPAARALVRADRRTAGHAARLCGSRGCLRGERAGGVGCFFFSSRRRHTRLQGDWSSDVCSSDLRDIRELAQAIRDYRPVSADFARALKRLADAEASSDRSFLAFAETLRDGKRPTPRDRKSVV